MTCPKCERAQLWRDREADDELLCPLCGYREYLSKPAAYVAPMRGVKRKFA